MKRRSLEYGNHVSSGQEGEVCTFHCIPFWGEIHFNTWNEKWRNEGRQEKKKSEDMDRSLWGCRGKNKLKGVWLPALPSCPFWRRKLKDVCLLLRFSLSDSFWGLVVSEILHSRLSGCRQLIRFGLWGRVPCTLWLLDNHVLNGKQKTNSLAVSENS